MRGEGERERRRKKGKKIGSNEVRHRMMENRKKGEVEEERGWKERKKEERNWEGRM